VYTLFMSESRTDEELVAAYLSGESAVFDTLVSRYQTKLFNMAYDTLGHYHDAEDAVQETWLGVWQNIRLYPPTRKFSSWLYGICRHKCSDELRRRHRKLEVPYPEKVHYAPDDILKTHPIREFDFGKIKSFGLREAARDKEAREWCLAVLSHRQRLLYKLVVVEGRPYEAILQEEPEFCPVPKGTPYELKEEDIEKLRQEFACVMDIVYQRAKERIRRDRQGGTTDDTD